MKKIILSLLLFTAYFSNAQFTTPTVNGAIAASEYGTHTDGQNQATNGTQVWYLTWDNTNLYVGLTNANRAEAMVIYLDKDVLTPINSGTNTNGTNVGQAYDGTNFAELQFRADLAVYVKNNYREYRTSNGTNGWSGATTAFGSYSDNGSNLREVAIPWSSIGGRPSSFAWFGYVTSAGGFVYGQIPADNSGGAIGTSARYSTYYVVNSTADGSSTKPFNRYSYVFNSTTDVSLGTTSVYDLTMNTTTRTLTKSAAANWTVAGNLVVGNGTVTFDGSTGNCDVTGTVNVSGGTLNLNGRSLTLKSTASNTARIAQISGTLSNATNVTVERFIPAKSARKWSFLSSPVTQSIRNSWQSQVFITGSGTGGAICGAGTGNGGGTDRYNSNGFDVIGTSAASLFRYNATQVSGSRWVSVANTSGNLTPGTGYRINIRGPRGASDANCADQLNNVTPPTPAEVTLSVTGSYSSTPTASIFGTTSTGGSPAWSLIGNPYPSEISLQAVKAANSNISTSFYFYSAQNGANIYSTYNSGTNQAANFPTGYTNGSGVSDVIVASGQAFFVSTTDASDGTVNFAESHKSSTATPGNNFYSRTLAITDKVRMGFFDVTNNIAVNDIFLNYLNESGASNTVVTEFDSYTFNSGTNLSSIKSGKKMVIQSRAAFTADDIVLLSVPAAVGAYRFDFSEYDQFTAAAQIVLRDKFLNIEQDVKLNNSYAFNVTADAASQGDNRFELVFKTATTLPVNFLGITAVKKNGAVEVSWNVAQETNLSGYQVERSTTGSNFSTIATVTATGANKYNNVDNSNLSGTVYYRIKTIERSGTGKYSAVVKLNLNSKGETVSVYPNPVREQVQLLIANGNNGLYSVRIITAAGKEVLQQSGLRANGQTMTIATHQLAAGNYLLALTNANGETTVAKFVKQ